MKARTRSLLLISSSAVSLLVACGVERTEDTGQSAAALSFPDGNNNGYCASNPSSSCWSGTPLGPKQLALTLDDGPGSRTLELSAWLRDRGIQAAFFVNGMHYGADPGAVVGQVIADGHLVGNHTQDHLDITSLSDSDIVSELQQTDDIIAPYVPNNRFVFRAPFGAWSSHDYSVLQATAMKKYVGPIKWDMGGAMTSSYAADWDCWQDQSGYGVLTTKQCGDRYLNEIHDVDHGIILAHDQDYGDSSNHSLTSGQGNTVDMIKYIVPILQSQGYTFVRVDKVPDIAAAFGGTSSGGTSSGGSSSGGSSSGGTSSGGGGTCFNPTWTQTSYANSWWIEYAISGSITSASFEVVGGATTKLSKSYDKWVGSPSSAVPSGTQIRLHATNSAGQTATTNAFGYMNITLPTTDCGGSTLPDAGSSSSSGGSTTCFAPTWAEGDGANTWWVEFTISGSIASAYLEVPGKGNVTLSRDSWGKWAGVSDFAIPAGTSAVMHATNTAGAKAQTKSFAYLNVTSPASVSCP